MNSLTQNLAFDLLAEVNRLEIMLEHEAKELVSIGLNEILTNEIIRPTI